MEKKKSYQEFVVVEQPAAAMALQVMGVDDSSSAVCLTLCRLKRIECAV
jgi:hypothetical protein